MRLPNGFGNVSKLSGKRRNPWRVRKTVGWEIDEKTKKTKQIYETIGYYPTRQQALQALSEYNTNPYDLDKEKITFAEVYKKWSEKKFEDVGESSVSGYEAAYKICAPIYNTRFVDVKLSLLQDIVDKSEKNYPIKAKLKTLLNQLFDYAVIHGIILKDQHLVKYLNIGEEIQSTKHYRFNNSEVEILWKNSENDEYIQFILMLIYSGVRPGELFCTKCSSVYLDEEYFSVQKGKNKNAIRKVPIHKKTLPFFKNWMNKGNEYLITDRNGKRFNFDSNHGSYTDVFWTPILRDLGILEYVNEQGETAEHLPDDTRHTFSSMWGDAKLNEAMRRKIQGHSGKGIGEIVYTHFDFEKLKEELNRL